MRGGGAFFFLGTPAEAASLSFGSTPSGWHVHDGEAGTVGTVKATGLKKDSLKKRIRYSVSGNSAFSVNSVSGVVSYNGAALSAGSVSLTISARVIRSDVTQATMTVSVAVEGAQPAIVEAQVETEPEAEPEQAPAATPQNQPQMTPAKPYNLNPRQPRIYSVRKEGNEHVHWHRCQNPHGTRVDYKGYQLTSTPHDGKTYLIKHAGSINGAHHTVGNDNGPKAPCYQFRIRSLNTATGFVIGGDYIGGDHAKANGDNPGNLRAKYITRWKGQMDKAAAKRAENSAFWDRAGHLNEHYHYVQDKSGNWARHQHSFSSSWSGKDKKCHQHESYSYSTPSLTSAATKRKAHATNVPDPVPSNYSYGSTYEGMGLGSAWFAGEGPPTVADCYE